ncbi:MAG TPA: hypothetical protein VFO58_07815 [Vicinamibacterales bacterium]|nr:hypothetical protein [Vicinamibacterales bacterium]
MPARVVLDHPRRHLLRRLWQPIATMVGAVLFAAGIAASIVAVPASVLVLAWLIGENVNIELTAGRTLTAREVFLAWAVATPLMFFGISRGLRLVRKGRTLVLFLRRFGYDEAQSAVTFAVNSTIGRSWRVVTLDDAEIAPVGVPTGTRWLFGVVRMASALVTFAVTLLFRIVPVAQLGLWIVVALDLVQSRIWERARNPQAWIAVLDPYLTIITTTFEGKLPIDSIGPTLPGVFALLAVVLAGIVIGLGTALMAAPVAWAIGAVFLFLASFPAAAVFEAEQGKTREIRDEGDLALAASAVTEKGRRLFGPQLVVLRVASSVWRQTVSRFASVSSVALIDVSDPTENLVWEIEELTKRSRTRCVFICQRERAAQVVAGSLEGPYDDQVARLLELEEILAYTTDRRGRRRFARALRGTLMSKTT